MNVCLIETEMVFGLKLVGLTYRFLWRIYTHLLASLLPSGNHYNPKFLSQWFHNKHSGSTQLPSGDDTKFKGVQSLFWGHGLAI